MCGHHAAHVQLIHIPVGHVHLVRILKSSSDTVLLILQSLSLHLMIGPQLISYLPKEFLVQKVEEWGHETKSIILKVIRILLATDHGRNHSTQGVSD